MPKYNEGPLPQAPPFQEFKQQLKAKYNAAVSPDGTITPEAWGKAVTQAANVVTKSYGANVKKQYLFDRVSYVFTNAGVDFRPKSPPKNKQEFKERLSALEGYIQGKGLGEEYMKNYDEINKLHLAAAQPAAEAEAEVGAAESQEEKKDEPIPKLRTKIKEAREGARGRITARKTSEDEQVKRIGEEAAAISRELLKQGIPPAADVIRELLAVRTGLDFSDVDLSTTILQRIGEKLAVFHQSESLSNKYRDEYKYLGAYRGSLDAMLKGEVPINDLDMLAAIHDFAYLEASTEQDKSLREQAIERADEAFVSAARSVAESTADEDIRHDANKAAAAISAKGAVEKVTGVFDLTTSGVKKMTREQLMAKTTELIPRIQDLTRGVQDKSARAQIRGSVGKLEEFAKLADLGAMAEEVKDPAAPPFPAPHGPGHAPQPHGHSESVAAEQSEVKTTGAPGGIEKKAIGLEDVLKSIQKMNASTNPLSITPVTGERNLRPLLVKGDVPDIVKRTPKEIADNRNYYAAWKWVQEGAGNGNQQPLPDQVGMPANNRIWDMQKRNERFKYMDNYDGGAKDWYQHKKATLGKYVRTAPVVRKKYVIPMYSDNQRHQWPTRNGGLPAGCGDVIKMARDRADGFEIFSPLQLLMAKQTRLFHGDVVESEGRLTRV